MKSVPAKNDSSKMLILIFSVLLFLCLAFLEEAKAAENGRASKNMMDDLNPFSKEIDQQLQKIDELYFQQTGHSGFSDSMTEWEIFAPNILNNCNRTSCKVWAYVNKTKQRLYLYIDGQHVETWKVSTGASGYETPNFDRHPNGRIYDAYSSIKFPGGDYNGLGNMPYAVFIQDGFAIHGTGEGNWKNLGKKASHGCIRLHPNYAYKFNRLVRQNGIYQVWITVSN